MKLNITKDWFRSRAHLEEGHEIGAGSLQHSGNPAPRVTPAAGLPASAISRHLGFGRFVSLMRRKRRWTIQRLAGEVEATREELLAIENDPHYAPELSTVFGLSKSFRLPSGSLVKMAGLAEGATSRLREESVRFAARAESWEPLTEDEDAALESILE